MSRFVCEICYKELSAEWVKFHESTFNYHFFCSVHGALYKNAQNKIEIFWNKDKEEFEVVIHG